MRYAHDLDRGRESGRPRAFDGPGWHARFRPSPPRRPVRRRRPGRRGRGGRRRRPPPQAYRRPRPGAWYTGPGEAHRYGRAPVAYGREHTYDYHLGDRYGYGPDFYAGEARVRHWRRRERPMRRPRRP